MTKIVGRTTHVLLNKKAQSRIRIGSLYSTVLYTCMILALILAPELQANPELYKKAANEPVVMKRGEDRCHMPECKRLTSIAGMDRMTLAEANAKGAIPCGRCTRVLGRKYETSSASTGTAKPTKVKYPKRKAPLEAKVEYAPDTPVYLDRLWFRGHEADCPNLILKEHKKTITLAEADKMGLRVGISGQSGRGNCCFKGYHNQHPWKELDDKTIMAGNDLHKNYKHIPGCHRYWPSSDHRRRTMKEWTDEGFPVSPHCIERGPCIATISDAEWARLGSEKGKFPVPENYVAKAYSPTQLPSKPDLEIMVRETLNGGNGIQELIYTDPIASVEMFMNMRFFFPVGQWLNLYQAYRATGDKRALELLRVSARHYNKQSRSYLSAAQTKARDPEGMAFMLSMALNARITLQLARQSPAAVSKQEALEAESMLNAIVAILKPICEDDSNLDSQMGIPKALADDFRTRAPNRATNGIGTLAMAAVALEDLQAFKKTKKYQPTIDRYRKIVKAFVTHFLDLGHTCDKLPGQPLFIYPYGQGGAPRLVEGCKVYGRPEDGGHYTHLLQGLAFVYQADPSFGIDDKFMTAVANTAVYNAKIVKEIGKERAGVLQCPTGYKTNKKTMDGKDFGIRDRFYMLEAFRDGAINDLCSTLDEPTKAQRNSGIEQRRATLYGQYLKALRSNRNLVHLGQKL